MGHGAAPRTLSSVGRQVRSGQLAMIAWSALVAVLARPETVGRLARWLPVLSLVGFVAAAGLLSVHSRWWRAGSAVGCLGLGGYYVSRLLDPHQPPAGRITGALFVLFIAVLLLGAAVAGPVTVDPRDAHLTEQQLAASPAAFARLDSADRLPPGAVRFGTVAPRFPQPAYPPPPAGSIYSRYADPGHPGSVSPQ